MSKPQWLIDKEMQARRISVEPDTCDKCIYYGPLVKYSKHKGKEKVEIHECDLNPGCLNTKYSICCDDFTSEELV